MESFNSMKYQTEIFYYSEDINYCESGEYACTGQDSDGNEYDITFTKYEYHNTFTVKGVSKK